MSPVQVGLGLWAMRSTARRPRPWPALYEELREDAVLAESLGFDSVWLAEHHFWYDGWCPQPLLAAASCLGATSRLRVGTAMHLLPQHDIGVVSRDVGQLLDHFGDRLDLGVSIGYRDEEYDAVGVERARRGRRMDGHLDRLLGDHAGRLASPARVFVGGIAPAVIERAGSRGMSLLLPNTLTAVELAKRRTAAQASAVAAGRAAGRVGVMVDTWLTSGADEAEVRERIVAHYREYTGAWFRLRGEPAFDRPDLLDRQSERNRVSAVVGDGERVLAGLTELRDAGADTIVLQVHADASVGEHRAVMARLAEDVLPKLRGTA
ncbi:LLM class flavin-dependent oxidoreductase [Actinophytocola oryzae]|uniref:Alkanesulfonate monooxygenase SsuD/methylene tetrahydromethanopterin reductase-like flavin-dependent oxidoreductase (Luciferase family) n=1 Tax=Actinophytocola oryzae TaxID=502181 RepID=A0A4R7W3M7_9PSEU|nr:LLM class flavin-dependent oxidoreductase [Actinophytocola oryzae]TDV56217.1 alkanesulfonate monooxygenase SsuD/methylene tetrahydromethanopterin reductase-like flavin-dependent oxidoreductase (luciferase family) [Actinophytocola oryzae]